MKPCINDPLGQDDSEHVRVARCMTCVVDTCTARRIPRTPAPVPCLQSASALDTQVAGNHYKDMVIQPVEFITRNGIGFLPGCVIKRVCRYRSKAGVEDLRKAIHELELMIELEYGK